MANESTWKTSLHQSLSQMLADIQLGATFVLQNTTRLAGLLMIVMALGILQSAALRNHLADTAWVPQDWQWQSWSWVQNFKQWPLVNGELRNNLLRLWPVSLGGGSPGPNASGFHNGADSVAADSNVSRAGTAANDSETLTNSDPGNLADASAATLAKRADRVGKYLSKRYRISQEATDALVASAFKVGQELKVDPLLLLSVMAIESGFNPFAQSWMGAQGLMQVMTGVHTEKFNVFGGERAAWNPLANIRVGARILKDCVDRGGSVASGLKLYVGAGNMEGDQGYGVRVLAELRRLHEVAAGRTLLSTLQAVIAPKSVSSEPALTPNSPPKESSTKPYFSLSGVLHPDDVVNNSAPATASAAAPATPATPAAAALDLVNPPKDAVSFSVEPATPLSVTPETPRAVSAPKRSEPLGVNESVKTTAAS